MGIFARREMLELRYRHCFTIFHGSMLSELHIIVQFSYTQYRAHPHPIRAESEDYVDTR
jgi:hypothetical protein